MLKLINHNRSCYVSNYYYKFNFNLETNEIVYKTFQPLKIEQNKSVCFKIEIRPLGFKNIKLIEKTFRQEITSGRTSFLHIKSEENYEERKERIEQIKI